ncbi:glycosyltransferase family 39 protein [Geobacter pelophilus]|uniref:Glycosyltransferase family 39 protein n=1 Tax=Geoanaerobacter pelophilus TaxID=60036 RepID=A0AAW4LDT6_9BACT|nr:glycosyltransferase family 39 protein [Geoanaerobacter pelophilus]MBT0665306.1 glycosyltransferase family 39 protein [Geoanaerobacter pelophilus]
MALNRFLPEMELSGDNRLLPTKKDALLMAAMVAVGLAVRLLSLHNYDVISVDGTAYVGVARSLRNFDFSGLASYGFYPVLVWLGGMIIPDLETAGRIVSVIFGVLLCVPVYLLGMELFSRRTAVAACTVMIVWPSLRHWSCEVMTQSTYVTLAFAGIYCVWRMMRNASIRDAILAGFFLSLAYVTRTEAILLVVLLPLLLLIACRRELKARVSVLAAYATVIAVIVSANILLVHHSTGTWQLAGKTSVALIDAIAYIRQIPDLNYIPGVQPTSYLEILLEFPSFIVTNTGKNIVQLLKTLIPFPFWGLLVIGLAVGGFSPQRNLIRLFLLAACAPLAVIIVYYYVGPEYTQPYIPVVLLFCAEGLRVTETFVVSRLRCSWPPVVKQWLPYNPVMLAAALVFAVITVSPTILERSSATEYLPESDGGRRDQKNLGLVLKKNLPSGKIMTRWSRIAFYSEREWANIPNTDYDGILTAARRAGARFLIVDGGLYDIRPGLGEDLFQPFVPGALPNGIFFNNDKKNFVKPGLRPFMIYLNSPTSMGVIVYEIF